MPGLVTLTQLKNKALQRADMENTSFIDTAADGELETYIQDSIGELYDLIIEHGGHELFVREATITTVAGTAEYVPTVGLTDPGIYKILDVTIEWAGVERRVRKVPWHERFRHRPGQSGWSSYTDVRYAETGLDASGNRQLTLFPTPQGVYSLNVYYLPIPEGFIASGESPVSFQGYSGWEEYVVVDVAMKMLEKEESDTKHLQLRKLQLIERIRHQAQHMNHGDGDTIRDISDSDSEFYYGRA